MSLLQVLQYPDERLRTVAKEIDINSKDFDKKYFQNLAENMLETMYHFKGVGLAATQINVHQRIIVIDVSETADEPMILVNPKILEFSTQKCKESEGCLSIPGIYENVERSNKISFEYYDINKEEIVVKKDVDGLLAKCVQHEIDHLNGKVFVDYLSQLKQNRIKHKLQKEQRLAEKNKKYK